MRYCKTLFTALSLLLAVLICTGSAYADVADSKPIWIDVRSEAEYQADHIDGDLRITHTEIVSGVTAQFPDKDADIRLYCRSGRRADMARAALIEAGYTRVSNAGGIQDARSERNNAIELTEK